MRRVLPPRKQGQIRVSTKPGEVQTADVTRLRDEVGFTPAFTLAEGVEQTVA
jgi:nucleoside-diphosphate-sugar epimerase